MTDSGLPDGDTFSLEEETPDLSSADLVFAANLDNTWNEGDLWNEVPDDPLSEIDYLAPWDEQIAQAPADLCAGTGRGVPVCAQGKVDDHNAPYPTKLRKFSSRGTLSHPKEDLIPNKRPVTPLRPVFPWESAIDCDPESFYCCQTWNPMVSFPYLTP